jgi:hypothetical protein
MRARECARVRERVRACAVPGRDSSCEIVVHLPAVSRFHATIKPINGRSRAATRRRATRSALGAARTMRWHAALLC